MADTAHWSLQDFADAAGKRVAPYPPCAETTAPTCRGCGGDLSGQTIKTTGLPRIYCGTACMRLQQRRWRSGPDESAALTMRNYLWN